VLDTIVEPTLDLTAHPERASGEAIFCAGPNLVRAGRQRKDDEALGLAVPQALLSCADDVIK